MSEKEALEIALKKIQGIWCETFGIKDLNEDFIPHLKDEVKEYLQSDIHLKIGSLLKLIQKDRLGFINKIKPTLEEPNPVLDDSRGILFIKEFVDKEKNSYFVSVANNYDGEWICSSHTKREFNNIKNKILNSKIIYNIGFQCSEVAGACDILESDGEVSKPSHLQIKYIANQDFGKNPENIIPQNHNSSYSRFKNQLKNIGESLIKDREKLENAQELQDSKTDTQSHKSHLRKQK